MTTPAPTVKTTGFLDSDGTPSVQVVLPPSNGHDGLAFVVSSIAALKLAEAIVLSARDAMTLEPPGPLN